MERFIESHYKYDKILFWSDLASSNYAKTNINWLVTENINFKHKIANPPNVPKARPIEDFWTPLSKDVYKEGWEAQSYKQMISSN